MKTGTLLFTRRCGAILAFLNRIAAGIAAMGVLALMLLINADVFGRAALNAPIVGVPEIVRLVIVGTVFLQISNTLAAGRMTRSTLGLDVLGLWSAQLRVMLERLFYAIGAGLFAILSYGAWPQLVKSWERGEYFGSLGVFTAPVWPAKACILFGAVLLTAQFALLIITCGEERRPHEGGDDA